MRGFFGFWVMLSAVLLGGCADTSSYRYKMTVEVETPDGLRTGNAVREVTVTRPPNIPMLGENRIQRRVDGEAVVVDLTGGHTLFALLVGEGHNSLQPHLGISTLLREKGTRMPRPIEIWPAMPKTRAPEFKSLMPMLVTFGDLDDPTSVESLGPKDLPIFFGSGVKLRRITVQITDDPVTTGIEERLGWMDSYRKKWFDDSSTVSRDLTTDALTSRLSAGSFSTEFAR